MIESENRLGIQLESSVKSVEVHLPTEGSRELSLSPLASTLRSQLRDSLQIPKGFVSGAGHQPINLHCGILAKFIAASNAAQAHGPTGCWVHFLSDQDVVDPFRMDLPVREPNGNVRRTSLRIAVEQAQLSSDAIPFARPAQRTRRPDIETIASTTASNALDQVIAAMQDACDSPNAGVQMARAMMQCASRWINPPCAIVQSRSLLACDGAQSILEKIFAAPEHCAAIFNAALKIDLRAARPLRENGARSEVPVWGVRADGCRERIDAVEAQRRFESGFPLLPRAFLASGLMRLTCDLFFHGTGGVRYERVGERWWRDFLGIELPEFGYATATIVPLPIDLGLDFDTHAMQHPSWREAWWDPTRLDRHNEESPAMIEPNRAALLQRIADAPRKSTQRRAAYRALCDHINALRQSRSAELSSLEIADEKSKSIRAQIALANDRSWPFLLVKDGSIDLMAKSIRNQVLQR